MVIQICLFIPLTLTSPIISLSAALYGVLNIVRNKNLLPNFLSKKIETLNQFLKDFSSVFLSAYNPVLFVFGVYNIVQTLAARWGAPIVLRKILGDQSTFVQLSGIKAVTELKTKISPDVSPEKLMALLKAIPEIKPSTTPDMSTELSNMSDAIYNQKIKPILDEPIPMTGMLAMLWNFANKARRSIAVINNLFNILEKEKVTVLDPTHIAYTPCTPTGPAVDFKTLKESVVAALPTYEGLAGTCRSSIKFQKEGGDDLFEQLLTLNKLQDKRSTLVQGINDPAITNKQELSKLLDETEQAIVPFKKALIKKEPQNNWGNKPSSDVLVRSITLCKDEITKVVQDKLKTTKEKVFVTYLIPKIEDYFDRVQNGTNMLQDKSVDVVVSFQNQGRFVLDYCAKLLKGGELVITDKAPDQTTIQNLQKVTVFKFRDTLLIVDIDKKRTQTAYDIHNMDALEEALNIKAACGQFEASLNKNEIFNFSKVLSEEDFQQIAIYTNTEQCEPKEKALGILVPLAIETGDYCGDAVIDETQKQYSAHLEESLQENCAEQMATFLRGKREEVYEQIYAQWLNFLKTPEGATLQAGYFPSTDFTDKHVKSAVTNTLSSLHLQSSENAKHTLSSKENRTLKNKIQNDLLAYLITRVLMVTENGYGPQLFLKNFTDAVKEGRRALDAKKIRTLFNDWVDHFKNEKTRELLKKDILDPFSEINDPSHPSYLPNTFNKLLALMFYDTSACKITDPTVQLALSDLLNAAEKAPALLSAPSPTQHPAAGVTATPPPPKPAAAAPARCVVQ